MGVLYELFGDAAFDMTDLAPVAALSPAERSLMRRMLQAAASTRRSPPAPAACSTPSPRWPACTSA